MRSRSRAPSGSNKRTSGRLTLLGDAAHAMLPHLGQGANQAIEDGIALAAILENRDAAEVLTSFDTMKRFGANAPK
jgi:salicylate hydroxylase